MQASIKPQKNGTVVAVFDADAARIAFACVIFASRFHEEIVPLARIVEHQLGITAFGCFTGVADYAVDPNRTR